MFIFKFILIKILYLLINFKIKIFYFKITKKYSITFEEKTDPTDGHYLQVMATFKVTYDYRQYQLDYRFVYNPFSRKIEITPIYGLGENFIPRFLLAKNIQKYIDKE